MTENTKGRNGGDRATPKTFFIRNDSAIRSTVNPAVVVPALSSVLPLPLGFAKSMRRAVR